MARPDQTAKQRRLAATAALAERRLRKAELARFAPFLRLFYRWTAPEDVCALTAENLFGAAHAIWRLGRKRRPGEPAIRVYNPTAGDDAWASPHTVVEIVNDDMPFLVDSVTAGLERRGCRVQLVIHPILSVVRSPGGAARRAAAADEDAPGAARESWIHAEIDLCTDPARRAEIGGDLERILADVRHAVADWRPILERVGDAVASLRAAPAGLDPAEGDEAAAFLEWMAADHFTFLGYRRFDYGARGGKERFRAVPGSGLGILRNPDFYVVVPQRKGFSQEVRHFLQQKAPLIVTKASRRATVHRSVYLDYVGVKRYGRGGRVVGEDRFVGLFTSTAYSERATETPHLRRKVAQVIERSALRADGHAGKALLHILETFPRNELFQISTDELYETAIGIMQLEDRPRTRLFLRSDPYRRFASCLVYVPRDRYGTALRERIGALLAEAFNGRNSAFYTHIGDEPLARVHFIIGRDPDTTREPDAAELEGRIVQAALSWSEGLRAALRERLGQREAHALWERYREAFPIDYQAAFTADHALDDIAGVEALTGDDGVGVRLYRPAAESASTVRVKLYRRGQPIPLSDCLPVLEHMGVRVLEERPFRIRPSGGGACIQDLLLAEPDGRPIDIETIRADFEETFARVWTGEVEDDGFNALVVHAGLGPRQVTVLRAYGRYLRQMAVPFSPELIERSLIRHPPIARQLVDLFAARFDPAATAREGRATTRLRVALDAALEAVASLDEDRVLRHFVNLVEATLRTNFFQSDESGRPKPCLALKLNGGAIEGLPPPRPRFEIFVYAPRFEGVHLRGGHVARGGLRWSDRREDFRTEILGLMKAQTVKNAVIVPVGAKGGFVLKRPPGQGGRDAVQDEGVACYELFVNALLDVTDNLVEGEVVPPPDLVRRDGDDPYLVVAADKGTATFSDLANGIARAHGFWLGDAFASGGSVGYDHKKMGITARGAWESVKRHFREIGTDIQVRDFTVVGIGDMSGDVFGNGMLLSRHIKLVGAFNHRHIFLDPDPDPRASYRERRRLFRRAGSQWTDYDAGLISAGGGVFDRRAKSIRLAPEARRLLGVGAETMTPNRLIAALLKAPVDLLWNGGIGTYVKARAESHAEVGDRANDAARIDAGELRCKVVGEGGNLGLTQLGRIEYAARGGRINSDAIDNSGGVACSDREVNIKILLGAVVAAGKLASGARDELLAGMTGEVAALVLRDNYLQSQAITATQARAAASLDADARLIRALERRGVLDRAMEYLPDEEEIAERRGEGRGLTRPEIAVLLSYAKMVLYRDLLASPLPDDPYLAADLHRYFPRPLRRRHARYIESHRLRREIIATFEANSIVNRAGPTFVSDIADDLGHAGAAIVRAYAIAREVFDLRSLWGAIEALDGRVPATRQTDMTLACQRLIDRATRWFLANLADPVDIGSTVEAYRPGVRDVADRLASLAGEIDRDEMARRARALKGEGVPAPLAKRMAGLPILATGCDIVHAARSNGWPVERVARTYFALGARLEIDWLRAQAEGLRADGAWEQKALSAIVEDLYSHQQALACRVLGGEGAGPSDMIESWMDSNRRPVERLSSLIGELRAGGGIDIARLAIASRHVRAMSAGASRA